MKANKCVIKQVICRNQSLKSHWGTMRIGEEHMPRLSHQMGEKHGTINPP